MPLTVSQLRRYALARSLFKPTTLVRAIAKLGFVQADPLRAPARAQDLTLRHRVRDYRAGDLERRYRRLPIEEDFFVNYGFLGNQHHALMHPRTPRTVWPESRRAQAQAVLAFVRERGVAHPREVDAQFKHGKVRNWFGGSSNASTELLDGMHYRGLLRVARRDGGTRVYAAREPWPAHGGRDSCQARMDALVDLIVATYAPLPARSLGKLVSALRVAAPQWTDDRKRALAHATSRLSHAEIEGIDWYWPTEDNPASCRWQAGDRALHLLAPFDPVVWDRLRFEAFWGWSYRFEAYTPAAKRKMGYYALPLLWGEQVIGWCNLAVRDARLVVDPGFVAKRPSDAAFRQAFDEELQRMSDFLGL
ncbi:MAG: DNA glycosylase AlkZ-like family protein [Burkholderiales bacterium]